MVDKAGKKSKAGDKKDDSRAKSTGSKKSAGKNSKEAETADIKEEDYIPVERKAEIGQFNRSQWLFISPHIFTSAGMMEAELYTGRCNIFVH